MTLPALVSTRKELGYWRASVSGSVGFVPTLGNLHEGHVFLAKTAKEQNEHAIVSIYVNPKQFGEGEDFDSYPRTLDTDLQKLKGIADVVFCPNKDTIYPEGFDTHVKAGKLAKKLCGQFRPTHFDGVVTVVLMLLRLVKPTTLYLGKKDYQQLAILKKMVEDFLLEVKVVGVETQRNEQGLALSSRNQYLSPSEIAEASHIRKCLLGLQKKASEPGLDAGALAKELLKNLGDSPNIKPQYAELRYKSDLTTAKETRPGEMVALVAAFLGKARLIDNIEI
jgi:pantoate--beta-alanine ligase